MTAFSRFRSFEALDACHVKIQHYLDEMAILSEQIESGRLNPEACKKAEEIEIFFSTTARNHHAMEEEEVFPCLLISENTETVAKVRDLIEDHFWIEKYWLDLAPMLKALGTGTDNTDTAQLSKAVKLFFELCCLHIESEESMIYPEAKAVMNSMQAINGTS